MKRVKRNLNDDLLHHMYRSYLGGNNGMIIRSKKLPERLFRYVLEFADLSSCPIWWFTRTGIIRDKELLTSRRIFHRLTLASNQVYTSINFQHIVREMIAAGYPLHGEHYSDYFRPSILAGFHEVYFLNAKRAKFLYQLGGMCVSDVWLSRDVPYYAIEQNFTPSWHVLEVMLENGVLDALEECSKREGSGDHRILRFVFGERGKVGDLGYRTNAKMIQLCIKHDKRDVVKRTYQRHKQHLDAFLTKDTLAILNE